MKASEELVQKIEGAESVGAELHSKDEMILNRMDYLASEAAALRFPVSQGNKQAINRLAEVDAEIASLQDAAASNANELQANAEEIGRLRVDLAAALLAEMEHERDVAALELVENQAEILRLRFALSSAESAGGALLHAAQALNEQVRTSGGVPIVLEWPFGSDEKKAEFVTERLNELKARVAA